MRNIVQGFIADYFTHYLVIADIADDKRRAAFNRIILGYLYRQQASVYEGELSASNLKKLLKKIKPVIDKKKDCVIVYPLVKGTVYNKIIIGKLKWSISHIF